MDIGKTRIACGPICFALQYRNLDGGAPHSQGAGGAGGNHADQGVCLQVVGNVADKETELLRFDCFDGAPHYHYGPRAKNERIFLDTTLVPDALRWTLDLFKRGKLRAMIERAGYPTTAAALDEDVIATTLPEVEAKLQAMCQADPR